MRGLKRLGLLAVCLLQGCSQPAVQPEKPAFQRQANTVRDWNDVAGTIASAIAQRGFLESPFMVSGHPIPQPIYIRNMAPGSEFVHAVADQLQVDLLARGGTIALTPEGATVVNLDVDYVAWGPRQRPPGPLGTAAALATTPGLIAGSVAMSTPDAAAFAGASALALGAAADTVMALTPMSNSEAIWKATIVSGNRIVMRLQQPIYIRDSDIPLYSTPVKLAPMTSSTGEGSELPVRSIALAP